MNFLTEQTGHESRHHIAASTWHRIRHNDGRWLHCSGEGWISREGGDEGYSYLGTTQAVKAIQAVSETLLRDKGNWYLVDVTRDVRGLDQKNVYKVSPD